MSDFSEKKKPHRPGAQFVVRCEPELAAKVKAKAKAMGRKTEPHIRQILAEDVERPAPADSQTLARIASKLQDMLRGIEIPLTLPGNTVSVM